MTFNKKEWLKRIVQFPGRRKLTSSGIDNVYNVERAEGEVLQAGDGFTKENMDDLEERIASGFEDMKPFYGAYADFPTVGDPDILYIDNTVDPRLMYTWDQETSTYIPTGGSEEKEQVYFGAFADFPTTGNSEMLYVDTSNTAVLAMYRWNGTAYVPSGGGAADLDVVAQEFDATKAYTKDTYVIYSGELYCFTSDKAAGAWDASVVDPTTVGAELCALNTKIDIKYISLTEYETDVEMQVGSFFSFDAKNNILGLHFSAGGAVQSGGSVKMFTLPDYITVTSEITIISDTSSENGNGARIRINTSGEVYFLLNTGTSSRPHAQIFVKL